LFLSVPRLRFPPLEQAEHIHQPQVDGIFDGTPGIEETETVQPCGFAGFVRFLSVLRVPRCSAKPRKIKPSGLFLFSIPLSLS
jgi:hypothetical protein